MVTVANVRKSYWSHYVGRRQGWNYKESPFHNPFHLVQHGTREDVILLFAKYFYAPEQAGLRKKALELPQDAILGCWCVPKLCHAEIIAGYVNWKRGNYVTAA
jgi:hypothetical protein